MRRYLLDAPHVKYGHVLVRIGSNRLGIRTAARNSSPQQQPQPQIRMPLKRSSATSMKQTRCRFRLRPQLHRLLPTLYLSANLGNFQMSVSSDCRWDCQKRKKKKHKNIKKHGKVRPSGRFFGVMFVHRNPFGLLTLRLQLNFFGTPEARTQTRTLWVVHRRTIS